MRARIALAGLVVVAGAATIALLAGDDQADGTPKVGRWAALQPSPVSRSEVGAARIGSSIYVVGGFIPPTLDTTGQVERYDIDSHRWSLVAPLPVNVNHPAVASAAGRLYVYGGYTGNGALADETDTLQRYDPATGAWTRLTGSGTPRGAATLAAAGGRLYAIGGAQAGKALNLAQVYDIARDEWLPGPSMAVAREHLASAVLPNRILVLGGRAGGQNLNTVEQLNLRSGRWSFLRPLGTARSGFGAATTFGRVVAVGGEQLAEGDQTIAPVELYDPSRKRGRRLPAMLTPRHGLGVVSRGDLVFAIEGGPTPGAAYSNTLEVLRVPKPTKRR